MNTPPWKTLPNIDMNCFGCGPQNTEGLQMTFETNGEKLRSTVTVPEHMRGWNNIVHGGILSTICDEIMSWSAIYLTQKFILTKTLTVSFLKPVMIETALTATGFIREQSDERHAILTGEITDPQGQRVTTCQGEFVLFSADQFRQLKVVPEEFVTAIEQGIFHHS